MSVMEQTNDEMHFSSQVREWEQTPIICNWQNCP
jgi:hypothetical protein